MEEVVEVSVDLLLCRVVGEVAHEDRIPRPLLLLGVRVYGSGLWCMVKRLDQ